MKTIEDRIQSTLQEFTFVADRSDYNTKEWTSGIMNALSSLGEEFKWDVCGGSETGWLFDLTWYSNDEKDRLNNVHLAVECEWDYSFKAIKYDFEKLILARCSLRLMIFQAKSDEIIIERMKQLNDLIDNCSLSQSGDRYLFAGLNHRNDFQFESKTV
jgi:hypothetical protein